MNLSEFKGAERPHGWRPLKAADILDLPAMPRDLYRIAHKAFASAHRADEVVAAVADNYVWIPAHTEYGWFRKHR